MLSALLAAVALAHPMSTDLYGHQLSAHLVDHTALAGHNPVDGDAVQVSGSQNPGGTSRTLSFEKSTTPSGSMSKTKSVFP